MTRLLLILPFLLLSACREYAVEDMLAAYDDYLHDHYLALADEYERQDMPRPTREWFDDSANWPWEAGTERRDCLVDAGESKRYRDHPFWACEQEVYESEEPGSLRDQLPTVVERLGFLDAPEAQVDACARVGDDIERFFDWRSCRNLDPDD